MVAHQAPLSVGFPRQEYWNGLPLLSSGDLPDPEIEPTSPALAGGFFTTELLGKPGGWLRLLLLSSVQFSHSVVSDSLRPHGLQHARFPCPSSNITKTPGACSNLCPLSRRCHSTISSSVVPFSSCLQFFPASGSFPVSQFFASGGQSTRAAASASVLPVNIQD